MRREWASEGVDWCGGGALALRLLGVGGLEMSWGGKEEGSSSWPVSRLTQSVMGEVTAMEWRELGVVRARVVARVPPMWVPSREIRGWGFLRLLVKVRRM